MTEFVYQQRLTCTCGASLAGAKRIITKEAAWGPVTFRHCPACGNFAQSPEIAASSLAAWYDSAEYQGTSTASGAGYHNYLADEDARLEEAEMRVAADIAPHLPPSAHVLEIGAATGSLLVSLRARGHRVRGIDLSAEFVAFGRARHGLDLECADFLAMPMPAEPFDMILLLGTIANLADPQHHLAHARAMLKPGGMLILNLPVNDSLPARLYGKRFWMFTPSVNTFYSRAGIRRLIEASGFTLVEERTDRQRPSFGKLAHHLKIGLLARLVRAFGLGETRLPIGLPLPGIRFLRAVRR